MWTSYLELIVVWQERHALALAHDIVGDMGCDTAGEDLAAVHEELVCRFWGVQDHDILGTEFQVVYWPVLLGPFSEL